MKFHQILNTFIITIFVLQINGCLCINLNSTDASLAFSPAVATWYGPETGSGSGGACGFDNDVANAPYYGLIAAGNQNIFKHGNGCGTCYQIRCTKDPSCSGSPITVTITDECPGACNNQAFHFDLSGKAFGYLAKRGQDYALRKRGIIDVEYQRVPCHYNANIAFKIDTGSNPNYLAFAVENVNIDGDLAYVSIKPSNGNSLAMKQSWGATWNVGIPIGIKGPYTVTITTIESRRSITAYNVIPANWSPGRRYYSNVNF
ncbi:hypothetical protein ACJIZ3_024003 [Penstemon smallii]|uniref:Uncharacterized protein n=1 Tax=Penstemon smallii TaxID=265156 RepID=A0ABD3TRL9_9LAMI